MEDIQVVRIARCCHEASRALCTAFGDDSQRPWNEADAWQRTSAIDGVLFHLSSPDATPRDSHENWFRLKQREGWVYAAQKNVDRKEHPCMLPFDELPSEQRAKDYVFRAIVHSLTSRDEPGADALDASLP